MTAGGRATDDAESPVLVGPDALSLADIVAVARREARVELTEGARATVVRARDHVEALAAGDEPAYGVSTGFGALATRHIPVEQRAKLQRSLIRSHAAGSGPEVEREVTRAMMLVRLRTLVSGHTGVRLEVVETLAGLLNAGLTPVVREYGSLGCSGDLAPLSHVALALIGEGQVRDQTGELRDAAEALPAAGLAPVELAAKEGLALINGTQFIAAHGVLGLERMKYLLDHADIIGAMSLEALLGSVKPFAEQLHELRPYQGTKHVAMRLRMLLEDSEMVVSHAHCHRVQDPYSLRCMPQVHGAARNAWLHLKEMLCVELNSVTDNPVILDAGHSISGGNFHGQPLAIPLDYATTAVSALGNISDRRTYLLLEGKEGLPRLLMKDIGINSGFMIPQYTSAALASENKNLCFPASADSIPTSLGQEDHVSMGSISGRKLNMVLDNLEHILAVELLSAAQAFDFRSPLKSSALLEACHDEVRRHIDHANEDRIFGDDLDVAVHLIRDHVLLKAADAAARAQSLNLEGEAHDLFGIY